MTNRKYQGPKQSTIKWPPLQTVDEDGEQLRSGEPLFRLLRRYSNDKSLSAHWWMRCCECGFRHLMVFNLFQEPKTNDFWLVIRPFGDDDSRPKKVVRAGRKR